MSEIVFTIIMPTYNSEATIRYSLDSIQKQTYDLEKVECLVIDGGSTDNTIEIALSYSFVKVLKNENKLPEYAKLIGFKKASGKYIIKMDSDEAFCNVSSLSDREKAFSLYKSAHLLVADRLVFKKHDNCGVAGNYINVCGDPFTYFIYRPKRSIVLSFEKNIEQTVGSAVMLKFSENDLRPIADGGTTTVDFDYIKKCFSNDLDDISFICSVSDKILDKTGCCICLKNDNIYHRSKSQIKTYLKKIRFRIINNIFNTDESGFSTRAVSKNRKKLMFPFYTLSFFIPLYDAIKLSVEYHDSYMMLHVFYCYYTCFCIVWYYVLKLLKIRVINKEY